LVTRRQADFRAQPQRRPPLLAPGLPPPWHREVVHALGLSRSGHQPVARLPSAALRLTPVQARRQRGRALRQLEAALRNLPIPVLGRVDDDALWLDLRQLDDEPAFLGQWPLLREALG